MLKEKYYEMVEEANSPYSWQIIPYEKYVFKEGEEKEFAKFLKAWSKKVRETHLAGKRYMDESYYVESLTGIFINNLTTLNWEKVWLNINPKIYNDYNKFVFKYLMKQISLSKFKEKINKCDDLLLVYNLYNLYAKVNNISFEKLYDQYVDYVDKYIKRTNSSYEQKLDELMKRLDINIEKDYADIICILIQKADLNYSVSHRMYPGDTITLKNQIADYLSHMIYPGEKEKKIINTFLNTTNEMYYDISGFHTTDICDLNIIAGNIEEARRIFNSDEYQLYSQEQLEVLTKNREYNVEGYGYPIDRLYNLIQHANMGVNNEFVKELLYSKKVKMIDARNLFLVENVLNSEQDFIKYLIYLIKNKIIYAKKDKVVAFNTIREVFDYLNIRFNGEFYEDSYEKIINDKKILL